MGYQTDFSGEFNLDKPLTVAQLNYLTDFSRSRRMKRDAAIAAFSDPVREAVNLPVGEDGGYYVGSANQNYGQVEDSSIKGYNEPPAGQPGLWCQWVPTEDGKCIVWDEGEKFYNYFEWLHYLIEHFIKPWGLVLNGRVDYQGAESDDRGYIRVENNKIFCGRAKAHYSETEYRPE